MICLQPPHHSIVLTPDLNVLMSFAPKPLRRRKAKAKATSISILSIDTEVPELPEPLTLLRTSRQLRAAYRQRTVPVVTSKGIHGTYTFPAPFAREPQSPADESTPSNAEEPASASGFPSPPPPSGHMRKRTVQSHNWTARVIPEMLPLYQCLLRTTQSLSRFQTMDLPLCSCGGEATKKLTVLCIAFDCKCIYICPSLSVDLYLCSCPSYKPFRVQMPKCPSTTHVPWPIPLFSCVSHSRSRHQVIRICSGPISQSHTKHQRMV